MSRVLVLIVSAVVLLSACGTSGPPAARHSTARPSSSPPAPSTPPVLDRARTGHVLRFLEPEPGFRLRDICVNGPSEDCDIPERVRWGQYVEWRRGFLRRGDHSTREWMLLGVLTHADQPRARSSARTIHRRLPRGRVDIPIVEKEGGHYDVGQLGRGRTEPVTLGSWRGWEGVARVRLRYDDAVRPPARRDLRPRAAPRTTHDPGHRLAATARRQPRPGRARGLGARASHRRAARMISRADRRGGQRRPLLPPRRRADTTSAAGASHAAHLVQTSSCVRASTSVTPSIRIWRT